MAITGKKNIGALVSLLPTPVVLCGTYDESGKANLATLAWVGVCSSTPPAIQISLRKERHTYAALTRRRAFTVSVPSAHQAEIADYCGLVSGKDVDKFAVAGLTQVRGEFADAPIVLEMPICMECRLLHVLEIGSHDLFVGEVLASWMNESCLEPDGSLNPLRVYPMAFAPRDGRYYSMGGSVARAFDVGKTLKSESE